MDRKEAILRIKDHMEHHGIGKYPHLKLKEALDMAIAALSQPNEPLMQADLDEMDYDKVWLDYGGDGEWALVVSGRIYAMAVLEGAGFGDILRDEVDGETMDRPSGNYTVYRCPPEAKDNNVPTNEPLTIEQLREMDGEPVWFDTIKRWGIVKVCRDGVFALTKSGEFEVGRCKYYRRPPEGEEDT